MHAQCVSVPVPHVAQGIACCVSDEFIHGVLHLLTMMQILLCADSAPLLLVELLISKLTASRRNVTLRSLGALRMLWPP